MTAFNITATAFPYLQNSTNFTIPSEFRTARLIWKIFPPILILLGTVGNTLSIIVLTRRSLRRSYLPNLPTYLTCLAIADLLVLYTGLLRQWINHVFEKDIRNSHIIVCKLHVWLVYVSLDVSAWILVSVTIERALSVIMPYRVRVICTKRVHLITLAVICVVLVVINSHYLFLYECGGEGDRYLYFLYYIFPWIDLCLFSVGPFLFHIVGNAIIISRMMSGFKCISLLTVATTEQIAGRQRQMSSMTTTLLCLNLVYLVCTLPISIYFIHASYWQEDDSTEAEGKRRLVYAWVNLLMYLNNSTNFITYTLSMRRFRKELCSILCGRANA